MAEGAVELARAAPVGVVELIAPLVRHLTQKDPRSAVPESLSMRMCFRAYRLRAWLRWAWAMARCVSRMPNMTSLAMICITAMVSFTTPLMMATTMSTDDSPSLEVIAIGGLGVTASRAHRTGWPSVCPEPDPVSVQVGGCGRRWRRDLLAERFASA